MLQEAKEILKNPFRKRTEEETELMKENALKYCLNFLLVIAINVIATWLAVVVAVCIFGPRAITPMGRTEIRESLDVHFSVAYVFMLALSVLCIIVRRGRFTYGDPVAEWNADKKELFIRNSVSYLLVNIPVTLYFLIVGVTKVYKMANTTSGAAGIARINTAEALWVANFFAPQATFYRLTRSLVLGVVLNLVVYYALTAYFYLIRPLKPPRTLGDAEQEEGEEADRTPPDEKE